MSNWLDFSGNSNLFKQIYAKGFVDISGGDFIARNGNLRIANDSFLNNRLFVANDAFLNKKLIVNSDSSFNGNVIIGKDLIVVGRLAVKQYTQQTIINTVTSNFTLFVGEDLSLSGNFIAYGKTTLNNDVSLNNRLFLNNNSLYVNGKLFTGGSNYFIEDVSMSNRL